MLVDSCCGRLFVQVVGEGPDVVLWPSLLCDGWMWHEQIPRLSAEYRVIVVDPPGHGRSAPTTRRYSLDDCVGAALSVLDAVDADAPAWCGLSWGGMVGLRLAARHPARVSALVLADTSARTSSWWQRLRYGALAALERQVGPIAPLMKQIIPLMFAHPSMRTEEVRWFQSEVRSMDRASIGHAVEAVLLWRDDASHLLPTIAVPTLVIVGEEDTALAPEESEHLAAHIPGARLVTLPAAGHLSCLEAPELFTAELMSFLAAHRPAAPPGQPGGRGRHSSSASPTTDGPSTGPTCRTLHAVA